MKAEVCTKKIHLLEALYSFLEIAIEPVKSLLLLRSLRHKFHQHSEHAREFLRVNECHCTRRLAGLELEGVISGQEQWNAASPLELLR